MRRGKLGNAGVNAVSREREERLRVGWLEALQRVKVEIGDLVLQMPWETAERLGKALRSLKQEPETGYERQVREERDAEQRMPRDYGDR